MNQWTLCLLSCQRQLFNFRASQIEYLWQNIALCWCTISESVNTKTATLNKRDHSNINVGLSISLISYGTISPNQISQHIQLIFLFTFACTHHQKCERCRTFLTLGKQCDWLLERFLHSLGDFSVSTSSNLKFSSINLFAQSIWCNSEQSSNYKQKGPLQQQRSPFNRLSRLASKFVESDMTAYTAVLLVIFCKINCPSILGFVMEIESINKSFFTTFLCFSISCK